MADGERRLAGDTEKSKRLISTRGLKQGKKYMRKVVQGIAVGLAATAEQTAFYVELFQKVTQTAEYKDYMEKQALKPIFLRGPEMLKFLEEDDTLNKSLMTEAGFVAQ